MKSYYRKMLEAGSLLFLIPMMLILFLGYNFRQTITVPYTLASSHTNILIKFGLPINFFTGNVDIYYTLLFILSMISIVSIYFLCKFTIGRLGGLVSALFFAVYPYFVVKIYSAESVILFFFLLYLIFTFIAFETMLRRWGFAAGIMFVITVMLNPSSLLLCLVPLIYYSLAIRHVATWQVLLFFLIGTCTSLGFFVLVALINSTLSSLLPSFSVFSTLWENINNFIFSPVLYTKNYIFPTLYSFAHPIVTGTHAYLHYIIITLTALGALYSFINQKVRIITIIALLMLIQTFFIPFSYIIIFTMFLLLAGYMIDKVMSDVFKL